MKIVLFLLGVLFIIGCVEIEDESLECTACGNDCISMEEAAARGCPQTTEKFSCEAVDGACEKTVEEPTECQTDADCVRAGCSSQLCVPAGTENDIITTCEFRPEYECLQLTSCSCIAGSCGFEDNPEYESCLSEKQDEEPDVMVPQ
jgi:eight-cysteine-cluster-containing protein